MASGAPAYERAGNGDANCLTLPRHISTLLNEGLEWVGIRRDATDKKSDLSDNSRGVDHLTKGDYNGLDIQQVSLR